MRRVLFPAISLLTIVLFATTAFAHFGMVIPESSMFFPPQKSSAVEVSFSHPFELIGMDMEKPARFGVVAGGNTEDLLAALAPAKVMEHSAWKMQYKFKRPGVYTFFVEPKPYWEPAEDCFIIHYTKTVMGVFGDDEGWDEPVGLPVEIVPLTRPFGNYAGNLFQGVVLKDGKPLPNAEVEVELYNRSGEFEAPNDYMVTQVVKADENGVFSFTCPKAGWWGFAALTEADYTMKHEGKDKGVELGGVLWIQMLDYQKK